MLRLSAFYHFLFKFLQNCTYIESPGFPSDYSTSGDCSYTVNRCQDGKKWRQEQKYEYRIEVFPRLYSIT